MTTYLTIDDAAARLSMTPLALRKRCTKQARRVGKDIRAEIGDGIVAVRFGRIWRVRFPDQADTCYS
jgi:hypothetical protein